MIILIILIVSHSLQYNTRVLFVNSYIPVFIMFIMKGLGALILIKYQQLISKILFFYLYSTIYYYIYIRVIATESKTVMVYNCRKI